MAVTGRGGGRTPPGLICARIGRRIRPELGACPDIVRNSDMSSSHVRHPDAKALTSRSPVAPNLFPLGTYWLRRFAYVPVAET